MAGWLLRCVVLACSNHFGRSSNARPWHRWRLSRQCCEGTIVALCSSRSDCWYGTRGGGQRWTAGGRTARKQARSLGRTGKAVG
ncbi:hypothetical protein BC567DRAFT_216200 [Phyllosticta citribraziliensis]